MYEIETDVPMPTSKKGGAFGKYPFSEMDVGDSIRVETKTAIATAYQFGKRHDVKFASRKEGEGFRIWRVE